MKVQAGTIKYDSPNIPQKNRKKRDYYKVWETTEDEILLNGVRNLDDWKKIANDLLNQGFKRSQKSCFDRYKTYWLTRHNKELIQGIQGKISVKKVSQREYRINNLFSILENSSLPNLPNYMKKTIKSRKERSLTVITDSAAPEQFLENPKFFFNTHETQSIFKADSSKDSESLFNANEAQSIFNAAEHFKHLEIIFDPNQFLTL